jgi:hydroxyisourate hydrolase
VTRITTHVLNTAMGEPASGVLVTLAAAGAEDRWTELARAVTDDDGRVGSLPDIQPGRWRLCFATETPFFPEVVVTFEIEEGRDHLHLPLLLSPYGYSVYRGS